MDGRDARLAAWSALANAVVAVIGGVALFAFFAIGQPYGTISDLAGVLFALTLLPPARWIHLQHRRLRPRASTATFAIGAVGMVGLAAIQLLFLIGVIGNFAVAIPFTGVVGLWFILVGLLVGPSEPWRPWLRWAAVVAGVGLLISVAGLWLGTMHPLVQTAYGIGGISEIAWAVGLGLHLLGAGPTSQWPPEVRTPSGRV